MNEILWILYSTGYLVFAILFLLVAKKLFDLATPYSVNVQLTEKDNPAVGILLVGFLLGIAAIICSVFAGDTSPEPSLSVFLEEIGPVVLYGLLGIVLLFIAGIINDKLILYKFSNRKEIIESHNTAVSVIMAATYIGSGLIIAGAINCCLSFLSVILAFLLGQIGLVIFAIIYQKITPYNDLEELGTKKNVAAGLGMAGNLLAYSLVLMKGICIPADKIEIWGWADKLLNLGYYALVGCIMLLVVRIVNDRLFLPTASLSKEILKDRNFAAGLMEAGLATAMGAILVYCL